MALDAHGVGYSLSSPCSARRKKYDVFLSFRGSDTCKSFANHLYAALQHEGIKTFRDEEELERGQVVKPSLLQAIEESLFAIIVFSQNYATSTGCLDELQKILQSKKDFGLQVFPIFYGVDPSDVRHQIGSFDEAFRKHEEKFAHDKMKVQRWRDALKEVSNLSGWQFECWYEKKLIEIVTKKVWSKLYDKLLFDSDVLVGLDLKIEQFDSLIANGLEEVQFIGIWGMGGLGKTTLARVVYERTHKDFEDHCFLPNIRELFAKDGLISLQKKLLSHLNNGSMEVDDCYEGRKLIKSMLCNRKILLVLDDVSDASQLENLAGKQGWFGQGSRIIITTRDKHMLSVHGIALQYKMNFLNKVESLQLFCQTAFKGDQPNEDYLELSKTVTEYANGLPLALKVFGSYLCGRTILEWKDALKKVLPNDIFKILKVSFDGLEDDERTIFLDIACLFNGMAKDNVIQILENCGLHPRIGIKVLIEKSLVTEDKGCLRVHEMLQEMGKNIVFQQSRDNASKRSRIWCLEDADYVLRKKRGTEAIRGIVVRLDKSYVSHWDPEAFSKMSNLKFLIISSHSSFSHCQSNLPHGLNCLSSALKVIEWQGYPLDFLPSPTELDELVDLKLQHSSLKELWTGIQLLQSLKFIDLSYSTYLISTPNFDSTPRLQRLILKGCTNLVEVHHSLGQHKYLVIVDLKDCRSIKTLPTKFEMNRLETFILSGCSKVKKLPEFGKDMEHVSKLDLEETAITKLPQSLVNLTGLAILNLRNCKNLVCLPSDFQKLKAMKIINICGCSKFSRLPENLNENKALEELDVGGTSIKELPSSLNNLKVLSFSRCNDHPRSSSSWNCFTRLRQAFRLPRPSSSTKFMWSSFSNLASLVELNLSYCNLHDGSLLDEISRLSSLTRLDLCGNNFVNVPSSPISNLSKLECIAFNDCSRLLSLPKLPSNVSNIQASDCPSMKHYICSQQLWEFVESFESQIQVHSEISGEEWKYLFLSDNMSAIITWDPHISSFFMQPTRILTVLGSEVPSWFHNQNYFCVEDFSYGDIATNVSFIVNMPGSCCSSEWWGIAVCLVLENDLESANPDDADAVWWTFISSKIYPKSYRGSRICMQFNCHHQLCIIYIRCSSFIENQLQMIFFTYNTSEQKPVFKIVNCGWRVLCEEDVERRQNTRDEGCRGSNND